MEPYLQQQGLTLGPLLVFAAVFGVDGAFISLAISKWAAKRMVGAQVIETPSTTIERWLVETVCHQPASADYAACGARQARPGRMLAERERLNPDIQQVLDAQADAWGIKVANVEIKHVDLDESMVRAIAKGRCRARTARKGDPR